MINSWSLVRIDKILKLQRRWIQLEPLKQYQEIGLRSFGKGIFHKTPVYGAELGSKRVLEIHPGDLVLSNVFAWEGAVGVATEAERGMIGSHRFITYTPIDNSCNVEYLQLFFHSPEGLEVIRKVSPGSAGRNRTLNLKQFDKAMIPLPPIAEQRRIVARIEELAAKIEEARGLREGAIDQINFVLNIFQKKLFPNSSHKTVGDFAKIQSGYAFKSGWFANKGIRLVRNINIGHGKIYWNSSAYIPLSMREGFERFELSEGDILVSLDRPIISSGVKVARVTKEDLPSLLLQRVGRVCFMSDSVLPEYFLAWLQSPQFIDSIDPGRSNGVPHISQKEIERIPFSPPNISTQRKIVDTLSGFQAKVTSIKRFRQDALKEFDALLPAILDKAFKGEL